MPGFQETFLRGYEDGKQGNEFCCLSNNPVHKEAYLLGYKDGKKEA